MSFLSNSDSDWDRCSDTSDEWVDFAKGVQRALQQTIHIADAPQPDARKSQVHSYCGSDHCQHCLCKEQRDVLKEEFLKHGRPTSNTKKTFAETLGVSLDTVNVSLHRAHIFAMYSNAAGLVSKP